MRGELGVEASPANIQEYLNLVLVADDSSFQWAPPGGGLAVNLGEAFEGLFERFVARYEMQEKHVSRSDEEVWRVYRKELESRRVYWHLQHKRIAVKDDFVEFPFAWKNERWHCLQAVSFDLSSAESIREKAHNWLGKIESVKESRDRFKVYLLLGRPQDTKLLEAYKNAVSILDKIKSDKQLVQESDSSDFAADFAKQFEGHI